MGRSICLAIALALISMVGACVELDEPSAVTEIRQAEITPCPGGVTVTLTGCPDASPDVDASYTTTP
jgi:hypothetical protein